MPIYEYQCDSCSHRFEVKQSIKDDPLSTCERCGQSIRRLISSPGLMFKGSGWYITDYSDKMKPPSSSGGSTDGGNTGGTKEGSTTATSTTASPAPAATPAAPATSSTSTTSGTSTTPPPASK